MPLSRIICSKCGELGEALDLPNNDPRKAREIMTKAGYHVVGAAAVCPECLGVMSAAIALPHS